MLTFKCKNCGGEMSVSPDGELFCEFCGSKLFFTDAGLTEYRAFRREFLEFIRASNDSKSIDEDYLWRNSISKHFTQAKDDTDIEISYIWSQKIDEVDVYMTKNSVVYHFSKTQKHKAAKMLNGISRLDYPAADIRNLKVCFPTPIGRYELEGEERLLVFLRPANYYPLSMLGALCPEHMAWVVSRMENISCVLEYSGLSHNSYSSDGFFINPFSHQAILFGAWWTVASTKHNQDLENIRKIAKHGMGIHYEDAPEDFKKFIEGKPSESAFSDFEDWDSVIMSKDGFNGRRFAKYNSNIGG